jgi:hypothetical protein
MVRSTAQTVFMVKWVCFHALYVVFNLFQKNLW